jgi:hypothetical protein
MQAMNLEKTSPLVLSEKNNISPKAYKITLSTNLPGVLGFVSRHSTWACVLQTAIYIVGALSLVLSVVSFFTAGFDGDMVPAYILSLALPAVLIATQIITKKLHPKADVYVKDWLIDYLGKNPICFSEGDTFTSEVVNDRCGFMGDQTGKVVDLGSGVMVFKASNGLCIKASVYSYFDNEITFTAMDREEVVFLLRDRKDLLLEFFPDDEKIKTATNCL